MGIHVEQHCQGTIPFNIEKLIKRLLGYIPPEHLIGLNKIVILDDVTHGPLNKKGAMGIYRHKEVQQPATIEIAVSVIYRGMPRVLFYMPFVAKFMLANTLYHEIGHHYQQFTHGVKKQAWEDFADNYRKEMIRKAFKGWLFLFKPFTPLIRLLSRKAQERIRKKRG